MERKEIMRKLKNVGLVDKAGQLITFNAFKNKSTIHRFKGRDGIYKIAMVGIPGTSLWGFYFEYADDKEYLKASYAALTKVVGGDYSFINDGMFPYIKWSPKVPIAYGNSNAKKKKRGQIKINFDQE
jgi:hypothetical protein